MPGVPRIFALKDGAKIPDDIVKIAAAEGISTAQVVAIGGMRPLRLAYFDHAKKKYEEHDFDEFVEITSFSGNITVKDGKPFLHAHGTFGRKDLSVIGGHVMSGTVSPIMEVILTPTENRAVRKFDEKTGLNVIAATE